MGNDPINMVIALYLLAIYATMLFVNIWCFIVLMIMMVDGIIGQRLENMQTKRHLYLVKEIEDASEELSKQTKRKTETGSGSDESH